MRPENMLPKNTITDEAACRSSNGIWASSTEVNAHFISPDLICQACVSDFLQRDPIPEDVSARVTLIQMVSTGHGALVWGEKWYLRWKTT